MPRRNPHSYRSNTESDREKRNGKLLKAFRCVATDDSLDIAGCVRDLVRDGSLPPMPKIPTNHEVYILDPRIVRKEFNQGFTIGFDFARTKERIRTGSDDFDDEITANIGDVVLLGQGNRRKHLGVIVENEQVIEERQAIYAMLGESGLRGFQRKQYRNPPAPVMYLGQFEEAITDQLIKQEIVDVVETSFAVHQSHEFTLGKLMLVG